MIELKIKKTNNGNIEISDSYADGIGGVVGQCDRTIVNSISTGIIDFFSIKSKNIKYNTEKVIGTLDGSAYISGLYCTEIDDNSEAFANFDSDDANRFDGMLSVLTRKQSDYLYNEFDFSTIWNIDDNINDGFTYLKSFTK